MSRPRALVLGAGPAGLSFAHAYGPNAIVLERTSEVGGLSRSIEIGEGVFDIGGHSFHTPHPGVRDLVSRLMGNNLHEQKRDARVWFGGDLIAYPFQHHYQHLTDPKIVEACGQWNPDPARISASTDFEDWIRNSFGPGISDHFMLPYNRKLWARDLRSMSWDWVGQRVATAKSVMTDTAAPERRPLVSESRVSYPLQGGFGSIFRRLSEQCEHIELNQEVVEIDVAKRTARSARGDLWQWDRFVSTIPLPFLLRQIKSCPEELRQLADGLEAVSLKILMLLVRAPTHSVPQRIYIADERVPAHKIAFNHTSSPELMRRAQHAIMCEISHSPMKPAMPDGEIIATTTHWLATHGFLDSREDVLTARIMDVPLGYPINTHAKAATVSAIKSYLEAHGIHTIGRFGAWDYANSDECMRQGLELAQAMAEGSAH